MPNPLLPRLLPAPIPALHPLAEYRVDGERAAAYAEMKQALQVPWMGVVTMAYAHYPSFFRALWQGIEPIVRSSAFVAHSAALRARAEQGARRLQPASLAPALVELGYAPRELQQIRALIEVFSHGNQPYLLIASITRLLLEGGELDGAGDATPFAGRHGPQAGSALVLMEAHHADAPTRALYADIQRTLGLPFVNTDYRALARWPSYLDAAWRKLAPQVQSEAYRQLCDELHADVLERVAHALPNPAALRGEALRAAAAADAPLAEVIAVARLFQWLLPGLVTNVAFLREQLA
ncbi:MAG: hypothetical protein KGL18_01700 [Burkholderiales bacterium]|nr:hypothetical protein [Burkholderiales bacterium]MDE1926111.1 hypothetical protein [Burkholderiales bacterium]MDE2158284.1 hypothetical protein [Burkholderiales bacterium]MDE2501680.1 hypothetical protein [Burkholderiales bacterium]